MIYYSKSDKETGKIAGKLASKVIKIKKPVVIVLEGELGAGKTTFVKGFAKALGVNAKIKSPTFVLMKKYLTHIPYSIFHVQKYLYHLDCYRVKDHRDLATLDLKTIFYEPRNIVLVEWPKRVSKILPRKLIKVHIDHIDKNKRKITISNS